MDNSDIQSLSISALIAGDREEFARLVDMTSAKIYRMVLRILNDPEDAEDVLQETYLKAFRSLKTFEGRSSLSTWMYRIAVNEALMLLRKRKPDLLSVDEEPQNDDEEDRSGVQLVDWCCMPEEELLSSETKKFMDMAVQKLPQNLKIIFLLRDVEGLSIKETADTLNLTEVNVKARLLRARLRLREILSAYFAERSSERSSE